MKRKSFQTMDIIIIIIYQFLQKVIDALMLTPHVHNTVEIMLDQTETSVHTV